jgi:hypothetical protein
VNFGPTVADNWQKRGQAPPLFMEPHFSSIPAGWLAAAPNFGGAGPDKCRPSAPRDEKWPLAEQAIIGPRPTTKKSPTADLWPIAGSRNMRASGGEWPPTGGNQRRKANGFKVSRAEAEDSERSRARGERRAQLSKFKEEFGRNYSIWEGENYL